jgi:type IV pilus assembly protein PilB
MSKPRSGRVELEELLLKHSSINEHQLKRAREDQKTQGGDLGRILVDKGYITDELLCRALSHQLGIERVSPDTLTIPPDLLQLMPVGVCENLGIIAVSRARRTGVLQVATSDPGNDQHLRAIAGAVGEPVEPVAATAQSIDRAIRRHYYGEPVGSKEPTAEAEAQAEDPFVEPTAKPADDQLAALTARVERLERSAQREGRIALAVRAIGQILVEKGLVTREDYLRRARGKVKQNQG